ncbi:MAG: LytR/AlgR family response regulator transcription factor [Bacteroidia bacterium]
MSELKNIRVMVVEDQMPVAMDIEQRLQDMGAVVTGIATDAAEARMLFGEKAADVVLLDIHLGDEQEDGIDLAALFQKQNVPCIFLTAFSDAPTFSRALKLAPAGYLLKPFRNDDLGRQLRLALASKKQQQQTRALQILGGETEKPQQTFPENIFIRAKGQLLKISVSDINCLEALDNYTHIHTAAKRYTVKLFLKDVLQQLSPDKFVRIHRSFAVSVNKITSLEDDTLYIGTHALPIGRQYRSELMKHIALL